jgi:hypothetical protein
VHEEYGPALVGGDAILELLAPQEELDVVAAGALYRPVLSAADLGEGSGLRVRITRADGQSRACRRGGEEKGAARASGVAGRPAPPGAGIVGNCESPREADTIYIIPR